MFSKIFHGLFRAVYPDKCLACGRLLGTGAVCRGCEATFRRIPADACLQCGEIPSQCECWKMKLRTDGYAAPFFNIGRAQKAFYRFKFAETVSGAEYFGKAMADTFRERFGEKEIDLVCFVPNTHSARRKYPPQLLAEVVSRELNIPLDARLLQKVGDNRPQHSLNFNERIRNVKGIYAAGGGCKGNRILLVDDIRTTGATLNECAKVLKKAGAKKVYGVTALRSRDLQYF